jgi:ketosteroid isomerase-like protein
MPTNKEIIEAHYNAFVQGDFDAVMAPLADDISWTEADGFPLAGTYHGRQAVADDVFAVLQRDWDGYMLEVDEVLQDGDTVMGVGTYSGTYKATGRPFSARVVHLWRFKDGKAVKFEQVTDTAMVNAAID